MPRRNQQRQRPVYSRSRAGNPNRPSRQRFQERLEENNISFIPEQGYMRGGDWGSDVPSARENSLREYELYHQGLQNTRPGTPPQLYGLPPSTNWEEEDKYNIRKPFTKTHAGRQQFSELVSPEGHGVSGLSELNKIGNMFYKAYKHDNRKFEASAELDKRLKAQIGAEKYLHRSLIRNKPLSENYFQFKGVRPNMAASVKSAGQEYGKQKVKADTAFEEIQRNLPGAIRNPIFYTPSVIDPIRAAAERKVQTKKRKF